MNKSIIKEAAGPPVIVEGMRDANMFDVVRINEQRLIGEAIEIYGDKASVQVYEETSKLGPGESVESTDIPMSVELGPGLVGSIYDGTRRPSDAIMEKTGGNPLNRGVEISSLKHEKKWIFVPTANTGDKVDGGDIIGTVQEIEVVQQRIMISTGVSGTLTYISGGEYTVIDTTAAATDKKGQERSVSLTQKWPVRKGRPYQRKLPSNMPPVTGRRAIDCLFPIVKGGAAAAPEPFESDETVVQHQLAKWADADVVVYIDCDERGNEMIDVLNEFPGPKDPRAGKPLMECTVLTASTSDMSVAAREASIYTGVITAEHFRNMGYPVTLMADSTSRQAEVLREMPERLEEMLGEEDYPAHLGFRLAQLYERAGHVIPLGQDNREGALSVTEAASPIGDDISEPATQATLHIVKVFWSLDADLAYRRHFPAIGWLTSYSPYVDTMEKWFNAEVESDRTELRTRLIQLLREESELNEIVQLVGMDALSVPDCLRLEATRSIREDSLHQNAFHEIDTFTSLKEQHMTMILTAAYYGKAGEILARGVDIGRLVSLPVCEAIGRLKYTEEADLDKVYEDAIKTLESEIHSKMGRKGNFQCPENIE